ncbi:MAG: Fic family protein [Acidobacteria bacterium]|nr:Fic family protein [Acidobacteriota bacterium]
MRTYQETHPWLSFQLDLRRAPVSLWLMLGEAQSKVKHIAGVPLLPEVQEHFHRLSLARGALATTAIEGNTLTEEQVLAHLEGKLELPPSKEYLKQEVENVVRACNQIGERLLAGAPAEITSELIREYNRLVLQHLPEKDDVVPGEYTKCPVGVGRYPGAPVEDIPFLVDRMAAWLNTGLSDVGAPEEYEIAFGILRAVMAHLYLAWIHPFGDGNGRTARLLEFHILLEVGVPTVAAHLLSNHYNQTRSEYYRVLDVVHRNGGNPLPFVEYAVKGFVDALGEQVETIKGQQLIVHWFHHVHEVFRNQDTPTQVRRRRLVIDLTTSDGPVPFNKIRHISPRIAEAYAGKTDKTVRRDLNHLQKIGLVSKTPAGFIIRSNKLYGFLPPVRVDSTGASGTP